jgi:ABC-type phosphate/phosphonate transport system substrate-binding protein
VKRLTALLAASLVLAGVSTSFAAGTLHFVIMSPADPKTEGAKYEALSAYLKSANPLLGDIKLQIAKNYPEAVRLFAEGHVEGMFSGSFVASIFIAKGLAKPVVRPLAADGSSTYRTSVVAKQGAPPFAGITSFKGKRVAYCLLASAGDVFVRSLLGPGEKPENVFTPVPVDSHLAALEAVVSGAADYAVVKSTVFVAAEYPGLIAVEVDAGEHPDNTLIMPNDAFEKYGALISRVLLGLEGDTSEKAGTVKQSFGCRGFIAAVGTDFAPTLTLLRKARVNPKTFDFAF